MKFNPSRLDLPPIGRTLVVVTFAIVLCWFLWRHYMYSPWTRDGRVRAEVVNIAAQIEGKVVDLKIVDNQFIHRGDPLFLVDPDNYKLALEQAEATVQTRQADLAIRQSELKRRQTIGTQAISIEDLQTAQNAATVATALYQQALATRDIAKLNMDRTTIYAPANGYVTNLHLRVGDYALVGETKIPRIHIGDHATVKLMGVGPDIEGHVQSFARGISDANGGTSVQGLAVVNPIFTWVRLAQRIPVRIQIDKVPPKVEIAAGQTCTIVLSPPGK